MWTRRKFCKATLGVTLVGAWSALGKFALADEDYDPPEPDNLDEPTQWQKGDPEPEEKKVPATEPEQTSTEAPPSQPMDDDRGEQPSPDSVWVMGYWWWTDGKYVWVSGYWAVPPKPEYVYIAGYWTYKNGVWVYVRGGWGMPNTTTVVVYAEPRPVLTIFVFTAPIRIVRRNRHWRHHHPRRHRHRPHTSVHVHLRPKPHPKPKPKPSPSPSPSPSPGGPGHKGHKGGPPGPGPR